MLAAEHAVRQPGGLRALVLANSLPSMELWLSEANRLRRLLPDAVQETLLRHEQAGTTASSEYEAATMVFYARHLCRVVPFPPEVNASLLQMTRDPTVYHTMNGPNEFHCVGTLKDWTITERLPKIASPTLLLSGRYDEATPAVVQPLAEGIPNARWTIFESSSHMPHIEETGACMAVVNEFIVEHDP